MTLGCVLTVSCSFSPALTAVLYDLSRQIPQLKKDIQDGLLKMLSLVLMHKPLRHPGMPKGLAHQLASPSLTNIPEASDVGSITLALRTLGSFEFEGKNLATDTALKQEHYILHETQDSITTELKYWVFLDSCETYLLQYVLTYSSLNYITTFYF